MLHPCQTDAFMRLLLAPEAEAEAAGAGTEAAAAAAPEQQAAAGSDRASQYLLGWLSVAGPPLGLRLPPDLFTS